MFSRFLVAAILAQIAIVALLLFPYPNEEARAQEEGDSYRYLLHVLDEARERGLLPDALIRFLGNYLIEYMIAPDSGETIEQAIRRFQRESGESSNPRVEVEGYALSIDTSTSVFTLNVVEYEYFGGFPRPNPITVDYSPIKSVENWLTQGRYIEVEGFYDSGTEVLSASEVEADDDDGDHDYDDFYDDHSQVPASPSAFSQSYRVEIEGYALSVNKSSHTLSVNVVEYERFGNLLRPYPLTVDYTYLPSVGNWIHQGQYIEVEGSYFPDTEILRAYEIEREDNDDYRTPTAAPSPSASPTQTRTPTSRTSQNYRVEIEGYIASINAAASAFTVNVTEYEYFGGLSRPNPITVSYADLPSVGNWIRQGQYIEVEGNYFPDTEILRAYEIEREDNGDDDDEHDDD